MLMERKEDGENKENIVFILRLFANIIFLEGNLKNVLYFVV